jgi:peroxidase
MDPGFASSLKAKCPIQNSNSNSDPTVPLDSLTPSILDEKYYADLEVKRGVLTSDQTLMSNPSTSRMVKINSKYPSIWRKKFGRAMVKMGAIDVLTGSHGEIRKVCRILN